MSIEKQSDGSIICTGLSYKKAIIRETGKIITVTLIKITPRNGGVYKTFNGTIYIWDELCFDEKIIAIMTKHRICQR